MSQESFKIDSPTPHQAAQDSQGYYDMLFPAFEKGGQIYTPMEFKDDIESGDVLLLRVWDEGEVIGLGIVRVQQTFRGPELYMLAVAGERGDKWCHAMIETAGQIGREAKCVAVVLDGRPGWHKLLKQDGYRTFQVRMRKEL